MMEAITEFQGNYRFLSNFSPVFVMFEGKSYLSVEHAYQAAKAPAEEREPFRHCTPGQAKRLGQKTKLPTDWETRKVAVMFSLLTSKFSQDYLRGRLLATEDAELVEGNHWGDTFWGVCKGVGENNLGKLLMRVRENCRTTET